MRSSQSAVSGHPAPIAMTADEMASEIPLRTIHAYSDATGKRLGIVTMTMRNCTRIGGADGVHVRGKGVNCLLPITGLRFRVE